MRCSPERLLWPMSTQFFAATRLPCGLSAGSIAPSVLFSGVFMSVRVLCCLLLIAGLAACEQSTAPEAPPSAATQPAGEQLAKPLQPEAPAVQPVPVVVKPAPAALKTPDREQKATRVQPPFQVDLHLPPELLEAVEPGEPLKLEPLLPAFFDRPSERDFRLNGRLIESLTEDGAYEGAEFRIEIRR